MCCGRGIREKIQMIRFSEMSSMKYHVHRRFLDIFRRDKKPIENVRPAAF